MKSEDYICSGVLILDFGSQYTQLIARRFREMGVYSEIHPFALDIQTIRSRKPAGIVLSGGPMSVVQSGSYTRDIYELLEVAPLLGICYGMQLIVHQMGGQVVQSEHREYGYAQVRWQENIYSATRVWMSHGDIIKKIPVDLQLIAESENGFPAALESDNILCYQFHPEVVHTENGPDLLKRFLSKSKKFSQNWLPESILDRLKRTYQDTVSPEENILCALSGGVDSSVTATLLTQVFGSKRVVCVFVETGLLRRGEFKDVLDSYKGLGLNITGVEASDDFFKALKGKSDPEEKRIAIGHTFIEVFKKSISEKSNIKYLAQGTLYPDVIESVSPTGSSVTIKSHHNVGGLPKSLNLKLIEPLRELFKDEVRRLGKELKIPSFLLERHPFPGPGLGIRILGEVYPSDVKILQEADAIYIEEIKKSGLYNEIWQAFAVLLPVRSVGVQGDSRTYEKVIALRAVTSVDGMTAEWYPFSFDFLSTVSNRITNEVSGINRVVYDVSSKPPGTIEWE